MSKILPTKNASIQKDENKVQEKFRQVAEMYEKHFLRELTKAMRSTVSESKLLPASAGEKIFREQLDQEYVEKWGDRGGIGLGDMIYDQLLQRYGHLYGLNSRQIKTKGPLPIESQIKIDIPNQDSKSVTVKGEFIEGSRDIQSPWAGVLLKNIEFAPSEWLLEVQHENGLTSKLHYHGVGVNIEPGSSVEAGQKLGSLSADKRAWTWQFGKERIESQSKPLQSQMEVTEAARIRNE